MAIEDVREPVVRTEQMELAHAPYDKQATKRLLRKIDLHLIPILAALYLMSFLDRSNIGNARLAGLTQDLKMKGLDYNVALAIFFPFYVLAEIPSNLMMQRFRPKIWIPSIMIVWGLMCFAMGLVKSYAGLLATRAALGLAEGGLFPGISFYVTMWYRRHECGFRLSLFFSAATAAGAFGGLLARAIMELKGKYGLNAWCWLFIIEGLFTIVVGAAAYVLMHDYPDTAKFLTEGERYETRRRLEVDRGFLDDKFNTKYVWDAVRDWKIWVHMFITIGIYSPLYSFSLFLPTIITNLGYKDTDAQLMTVPPYVVACVCCIFNGWLTDRTGRRGIYMVCWNIVAIIGFILQIVTHKPKYKYLGTFFAAAGIYPNVPQTVAWNGNNIGGSTKRAVGLAMQVGFGNLGGVLSGFTYTDYDKPNFHRGHKIVIVLLAMSSILALFMHWWCKKTNFHRYLEDQYRDRLDGWARADMEAERDKGDSAGFFKYTT